MTVTVAIGLVTVLAPDCDGPGLGLDTDGDRPAGGHAGGAARAPCSDSDTSPSEPLAAAPGPVRL